MNLSDLSIRRPVFATVMSLLLITLGVMAFSRLTLRELPAIDPPIVSVNVSYPGASASVVETRITQAIEDALSREMEAAANDVRDAVSRVADRLPEEADAPEIAKVESDSEPIIWL